MLKTFLTSLVAIAACTFAGCGSSNDSGLGGSTGAGASSGAGGGGGSGNSAAGGTNAGGGSSATGGATSGGAGGSTSGGSGGAAGTPPNTGGGGTPDQGGSGGTGGSTASGACTNAGDMAILNQISVGDVVGSCAQDNLGAEPGTRTCIKTKTGLSDACVDCFDGEVQCGAKNCWLQCISDSNSPGCLQCRQQYCDPAFEACSGLKASP